MADSKWPDEPSRRKAVFVLDQSDIKALRLDKDGASLLLNKEVHVLSAFSQESNPIVQELINSGLARPGAVLIQSPFEKDTYENSTQAMERFALDKHLHFSTLCGYLGARKVTVEQIELKTKDKKETLSIEIEGVSSGPSVRTDVKNEELASLYNRLDLQDTFVGGSPDLPEAESFLRETGLLGDANMRSLLKSQGPINRLTSRRLRLNITNETQRNFDVLVNFNASTFLSLFSSLEADYNRHVKEKTEFTLTVRVDFPSE